MVNFNRGGNGCARRILSRSFNWRWSAIWSFVLVLIAYHAGAVYFGMSWRLIFLGAMVLAWFILAIVAARMFDKLSTPDRKAPDGRANVLGVGRAVLIGELVVNIPALGLMLLTMFLLGPVIQDWLGDGVTNDLTFAALVTLMVLAGSVGWVWWAIALPRWRVWALERVADPRLLYGAAISAQLMWPQHGRLAFLNRTEWKTARLSRREQAALQRHRVFGRRP